MLRRVIADEEDTSRTLQRELGKLIEITCPNKPSGSPAR